MKSIRYKNKDGIELNFGGMSEEGIKGSGGELIQEVVKEAITFFPSSSYVPFPKANP